MRWSLARMFVMTALVAVAAWLGKYGVAGIMGGTPDALLLLPVPILLATAVGTLAGHARLWFRVGLGVNAALTALIRCDDATALEFNRVGPKAAAFPIDTSLAIYPYRIRPTDQLPDFIFCHTWFDGL